MFKDLKDFAENEENIKMELHETKSRRHEAEGLTEDLKEKCHHQEVKLRTIQMEVEKLRRETSIKSES